MKKTIHKKELIHCMLAVQVEKNGFYYQCQPFNHGWKCGKCGRGIFPPFPEMMDKCKVCKSPVRIIRRSFRADVSANRKQGDI